MHFAYDALLLLHLTYVNSQDSDDQLFLGCNSGPDNAKGRCDAYVYMKKNHYEYRMYFPANEIGNTTSIMRAMDALVKTWARN